VKESLCGLARSSVAFKNGQEVIGDQTEALASAISSFLFPRKRFQTPPAKEGPNSFDMVG